MEFDRMFDNDRIAKLKLKTGLKLIICDNANN